MNRARALAFLGVALLAVTFVADEASLVELGPVSLCLLTGTGATFLAVHLWQSRPPDEHRFVSLGAVFCVYYAISYGFAILGTAPDFTARLFPLGLEGVNLAPLPLGILAWFAGYRLLQFRVASGALGRFVLPSSTIGPVSPTTLVTAYLVTVAVRVLLVLSGSGYGYLQDTSTVTTSASSVLQYAAEFGSFGVVILGLTVVASGQAEQHRDGYRRAYRLMLPVELLLGVLVGQKSEFLLVVVMFGLALMAAGRLRVRSLTIVGLAAVLIIFPLVGTYREILRPESGRQLSSAEAPGALVDAVDQTAKSFLDGPSAYGQLAFDSTAGRLREVDRAAVSIQTHDTGRPFSAPSEMAVRIAVGAVPRLLWPSKPLDLYSLEVSREYYRLPAKLINSTSLSPVGDAYRYGGLAAVGVVLALLGGYVRVLEDALSARRSIWLVPLLIAAIPLLRSGDLAGLLVGTVRYFLIVGVLYRFLFVRATGRTQPAAREATPTGGQVRSG